MACTSMLRQPIVIMAARAVRQYSGLGKLSYKKKRRKKGTLSPLGDPPPLNGSKGDICRLITDKSA